jgi:hypothetical protein
MPGGGNGSRSSAGRILFRISRSLTIRGEDGVSVVVNDIPKLPRQGFSLFVR